jgi:hypothetical protein
MNVMSSVSIHNAAELQPGDVLLMLSRGELSRLIAWFGDSIYSHSALVADNGDLIEAAAHGVRRYPLAKRLADTAGVCFIDAFRPLAHDGSTLTEADRDLVIAHAQSLLGVPYPLDSLAMLGVIIAVRDKAFPSHPMVRLLIREALDHLVRDNPSHMVCSELVYRSFAECDAVPEGRLAPRIVPSATSGAPFPHVDWKALLEELLALRHPARVAMANVLETYISAPEVVDDEMLAASLAAARAHLGIASGRSGKGALLAGTGIADPHAANDRPNPKLVTPLDLAHTPSHTALGRVMQAAVSNAEPVSA